MPTDNDAAMAALWAAAAGGDPRELAALVAAKIGERAAALSPYDVLTLSQAAAYLQVPENVVRDEAETGRIVGQKPGGEWRFLRGCIVDWLRSGGTVEAPRKTKSSKQRMLALAGIWKDDPTVDAMVEELYRERKRQPVGGRAT